MNETFDFVVVGSGGGSMAAALVARAAGKSVLILEKTDLVGGTTCISGGVMWIPNNRFMRSEGVEDSPQRANTYMDAIIGDDPSKPGGSRERRRAYVEEAPKMVDFLVGQGIKLRRIPSYPDYYDNEGSSVPGRTVVAQLFDANLLGEWKNKLRPGFLPIAANLDEAMLLPYLKRMAAAKKTLVKVIGRTLVSKLHGKQLVTAGVALQGQMLHQALKAGAQIRVDSPVKQLIVENGRVTGVVTEQDGKEWQVAARLGVLLNAGGFSRNQRMLDKYMPGISTDWTMASAADTGEVLEEAIRIGAAVAQMDECIGSPMALFPGNPVRAATVQSEVSKPHCIVVDQSGVRYMCEAGSYVDFYHGMRKRNEQVPAVPSWFVVDSQYVKKYMFLGSMSPAKLRPWVEQGFLRTGDTLEELAQKCGMDPAKFKASVERFNGFAIKGRDEDFHRGERAFDKWLGDPLHSPSTCLGPLLEGPFYAVQIYPGNVSTWGGVVTDAHARVLRPDGTVIPGLYATGNTAATVMARRTPGPGTSIGPSVTWGYVAAKHAVGAASQTATPAQGESIAKRAGAQSAAL